MRAPATRLRMPGVSWRRAAVLCALGLAAVSAPAPARAQTGGIQVLVFDPGGKRPVPGVEVTLSSAERHVAATTVATDAQGMAYFPVLRAGSAYAVTVAHAGYARQEIAGIRVRSGQVTRLPVRLAPSFTEKVTLTSRTDAVELDRPETVTRFGGDFIEDLPVMGRFYQDVLRLAAGVQDADRDGNPNVHGARATDFRTQVGGISNQDPLTGEWMSFVNPDSIEEIEILTAGAGVEYSRAQGGFASIIQRQGSNEFEGRASFLWRSDRLDPRSATDSAGGFNYFPGEQVRLSVGSLILGTTEADDRISPLNLFQSSDVEDPRVANMARLLQSLDADADPQPGITITPAIEACLDAALASHGLAGLDFADSALVESVLQATQAACAATVQLRLVSAGDAIANLERALGSEMSRRNVSKTPDMASAKAKLELMPVLVPATAASEEPIPEGIDYYDENGAFLYNRTMVKPLVAVYAGQVAGTGMSDAFDAMSSDRPYRKGMSVEKVNEIFRRGAGQQWDPEVIAAARAEALPPGTRAGRTGLFTAGVVAETVKGPIVLFKTGPGHAGQHLAAVLDQRTATDPPI